MQSIDLQTRQTFQIISKLLKTSAKLLTCEQTKLSGSWYIWYSDPKYSCQVPVVESIRQASFDVEELFHVTGICMRKKTKYLAKTQRRLSSTLQMESDTAQELESQEDSINSFNEHPHILTAAVNSDDVAINSDAGSSEVNNDSIPEGGERLEDEKGQDEESSRECDNDENNAEDDQPFVENDELLDVPQCKNPLQCRYCGKVFTRSFYRKEHERIHTGEKPFSCGVCGKRFNSQGSCRKHERTHSRNKSKMHECEHCGKNFRELTNLRAHLRTHTGEKPHSCDVCGRSFSLETVLKKHMVFHNRQKQMQGAVCKRSIDTEELRMHVRSHTSEKLYKCRYCNQSFNTTRRRNLHEKCHGKTETHHCKECGMIFRSLSCLTLHHVKSQLAGGCNYININDHSIENSSSTEIQYKMPNDSKSIDRFNAVNDGGEFDIEFLGRTLHEGNPFATAQTSAFEVRSQIYPTQLLRSSFKEEPKDVYDDVTFSSGSPDGDNHRNSNHCNQHMRLVVTEENGTQTIPLSKTDQVLCDMEMAGKIHECKHCKIIFREYSMFLVHKTLHINPVKPFVCHLCGNESANGVDFNAHLIWHMK